MIRFAYNIFKGALLVGIPASISWGLLYLVGPDMVAQIAIVITGALLLAALGSTMD